MIQKVFILVLILTPYIQAICDKGCEDNTLELLYEDIKCKPIYEKETDCCPIKYDCSHIKEIKENHCLFQGKFYKVGEEIDNKNIIAHCRTCRCFETNKIECTEIECPEWRLESTIPSNCYRTHELGQCCSVGLKCPDKEEIFECRVGNYTYLEGEIMTYNEKKCVCQKGFKGEFVEPFCRKQGCIVESMDSEEIRKNCAPVFLGSNCPVEWICPNDTLDKFEPSNKGKKISENQCKYGTKLLNINEKFETSIEVTEFWKKIIRCECKIPPMATCYLENIYDQEKFHGIAF